MCPNTLQQMEVNMGKTGQKSTGMSMYQNLKKQVKCQQVKTDRTIPKSKHDIIIRDNEKRNMYVNRCCNFRRQKCDKERSGEDSKIHLTVKNRTHVECKNKCDASNNSGNWKDLKIFYKIPDQCVVKAH